MIPSVTLNHFAYAADGNYALQLKIAVASLLYALRQRTRAIYIHVLDLGLTDKQWNQLIDLWGRIQSKAIFKRHIISTQQFAKYKKWNNSYAPYARLELPDLIPDAEWCLYADCDTLFLCDPQQLEPLLDNNKALIGHRNPIAISNEFDKKWFDDKSIHLDFSKYICSGLVAINLNWFREHNAKQKCIVFLDKYPDVLTPDQSALNYVCRNNIGLFSDGWGDFAYEAIKTDACYCLHYAGTTPWNPPKSWMFYCGEHKLLDIWYEFAYEIAHEPNLKSKFMPNHKFLIPKIIATILWPLLRIVAFGGIYTKSFADHALAIRQRCNSKVISNIRNCLFKFHPLN